MERLVFENGIRILMDRRDNAKTACFGIWVKSGSLYENKTNNGISHFIEHMVFKGSQKRSARDIAEEMDAMGGQLNAFTAKDYTCFYAKTLDYHVPEGFDILCDMVTNPLLDEHDIETEKKVVLEEINMNADLPDDRVSENMYSGVFKDSSLGMPILGTEESLKNINRETILSYMNQVYSPERIVISICGKFDRDKFIDIAKKYFSSMKKSTKKISIAPITYKVTKSIEKDDSEQVHMCLAFKGLDFFDKRRYALSILNIVTAGSSSSRLFQRIREELGLAYSIYSSGVSYNDIGLFEVQTAVNPSCAKKAYSEILSVLTELKQGITVDEFCRAKEQLKSSLLMGLESNASIAGFMGRNELLREKIRTEDDLIAEINNISLEDVNKIASEIIDFNNISLSVVGPIDEQDFS